MHGNGQHGVCHVIARPFLIHEKCLPAQDAAPIVHSAIKPRAIIAECTPNPLTLKNNLLFYKDFYKETEWHKPCFICITTFSPYQRERGDHHHDFCPGTAQYTGHRRLADHEYAATECGHRSSNNLPSSACAHYAPGGYNRPFCRATGLC